MLSVSNVKSKNRLSVKKQTIAAFIAIIGAVAVPQLFHVIGAVSGHGTALGETFLPMHLPIILAGLLAGPFAGAAAGLLGPVVSFMLTGMPGSVMLPFMMAELCAYGFFAGILSNVRMPDIAKILSVQLLGRAVRTIAVVMAVYAFGNENIKIASIWMSVKTGLPGIVLQLAVLPLLLFMTRKLKDEE